MVIASYNANAFCLDDEPIILSEVTGTIDVQFTANRPDGSTDRFTEVYTPDSNGQIIIRDLGRMALTYFEPYSFRLDGDTTAGDGVLLDAKVYLSNTGSLLGSFTKRFYYANCRTTISDPLKYRGFLSRFHRRTIHPDQQIILGFICNGQTLGVGIKNANGYDQVDVMTAEDNHQLKITCFSLDRICELKTQWVAEEISYVIFYLYNAEGNIDAIQFDIDRSFKMQRTDFIFYNGFGVPDSLFFTGRDTRTAEMEAEFSTAAHEYRKLSTELNVKHQVNSGYIDEVTRDTAEDLITSSFAWLYSGKQLGEKITITEVRFEESLPRTEPVNVAITYRLANETQRVIDRDMTLDYRIFDHTFGVEFE